jgi:myo-inositol-1(or 4)-monophosphatase
MHSKAGPFPEVLDAVRRAGAMALAVQGQVVPSFKSDGSYVTEMDREIEKQLRGFLHKRFPADRVMGEEGGWTGPEGSLRVWIIDPIDGTTNYSAGLPIWAVSLGLLTHGVPQWGCVFAPVLDQIYQAFRGGGATCNGHPIAPLQRDRMINEDILGITSEGVRGWEYRIPQKIRALGSAAIQTVFVASGHYAGYFLDTWSIWDIAAALLIAREAGVRVTDQRGEEFTCFPWVGPEKGPALLFAVPGLHAQILPLIVPRGHVADPRPGGED